MDDFRTVLLMPARADVKSDLAVCLVELGGKDLFYYTSSILKVGREKLFGPLVRIVYGL